MYLAFKKIVQKCYIQKQRTSFITQLFTFLHELRVILCNKVCTPLEYAHCLYRVDHKGVKVRPSDRENLQN
jgi:hypothetical protein